MTALAELIDTTGTYFCLDCGVCTGSCPVSRVFPEFSPRQIIERSLYELEDLSDNTLWDCLTCGQCAVRCPANINFPDFIRLVRGEAYEKGFDGVPAHNGMLQTISDMQVQGAQQDRTFWVEDGTTQETGDVFYFVGCRPFHDVIFQDIEAGSIQGAQNIVKLLNACGIKPVVSNDEKCCGHDAYWGGNIEKFKTLAQSNIDVIRASGAKQVVFSCPEGYHAFKEIYPKHFGDLGFEPVHVLDFLTDKVKEGAIEFEEHKGVVTYHDPCRLGRMASIYDAPRELLQAIPGLELREMPRSRENGACCGTTGWMNCSSYSGAARLERFTEAEDTGADNIITACLKCNIHFKCTKNAYEIKTQVTDLYDLLADQIKS